MDQQLRRFQELQALYCNDHIDLRQFECLFSFRCLLVHRETMERIFRFYYNFLGCDGHRFRLVVSAFQFKPFALLSHVQGIYYLPVYCRSKGGRKIKVI